MPTLALGTTSLEQAAGAFDRQSIRAKLARAEAERQEVLRRFPLPGWPNLPLEQYALGQENSRETFSRWLEFGTLNVGRMAGYGSAKHVIYKYADQPGWFFDEEHYPDVEAAWRALRAGMVEAFARAAAGRWEEIDGIEALHGGAALRLKALYLYFPLDLLPITSRNHLQYFLKLLHRPEGEEKTQEAVRLNRALLGALREVAPLQDFTPAEMVEFLYRWSDPREVKRIFKIAPGEDAIHWPDCAREGYICVGWDGVGDLRAFADKAAFKQRFAAEHFTTPSHTSRKANELWTLRELEPGDIVIANQGLSKVLAIGEVVEPGYEWRKDRPGFHHTVRVDWDVSFACDIEPQTNWGTVTIAPVSVALLQKIMHRTPHEAAEIPAVVEPIFTELAEALDRKKQAILYGPPGTGKTYSARRFAVWWLLRGRKQSSAAAAVLTDPAEFTRAEERLGASAGTGRTWWVVANPKTWSWGTLLKEKTVAYRHGRLQRNYPLVQPGDLVIGYQATPDKRIIALARIKRGLHAAPSGGEPQIELEALAPVVNGLGYEELAADPQLKESEPMRFRNQGTLFALNVEEAEHLLDLLLKRDPALAVALKERPAIGRLTRLTFHGSYSYEDFIEGFRPVSRGTEPLSLQLADGVFKQICRQAQLHPDEPFLVLVDEINRANVAKVFGEIITLLEADKRGMVITLPQSREPFAIPPNVYLLGTMNTADRSIKLLDAALRRRFAFVELMPDAALLRGGQLGPLDMESFLTELNRRIAKFTDRERQIGHSFLMTGGSPLSDPGEFCRVFRQEILPLLQEYCFEDYSTLADYLGEELVNREAQSLNAAVLRDDERLLAALGKLGAGAPTTDPNEA